MENERVSTNERLRRLGYTTMKQADDVRHVVLKDGVEVFRGTAWEISMWLIELHGNF